MPSSRSVAWLLVGLAACGGASAGSSSPDAASTPDGTGGEEAAAGDAAAGSDAPPADAGPGDAGSAEDSSLLDAGAVLRGAYPNPDNPDGGPGGTEAQMETLEAQVGHLDLHLGYHKFADPFPDANEQGALAHGRIPVVSLGCGDTNQNIVDGKQDAVLQALASAIQAAGKPVVVRWFWEMNLAKTANGRSACFDASYDGMGAQAPDRFDPAHYVAAWRHIHGVLATAPNALMFFCPSGSDPATGALYYPGDAYVEVNGFDVYDRTGTSLQATLQAPYQGAVGASATRPVWVGETGSLGATQATYLDGHTRAMLASSYPKIGAVIYFDSLGPDGDWSLSDAGLAAFSAFGP